MTESQDLNAISVSTEIPEASAASSPPEGRMSPPRASIRDVREQNQGLYTRSWFRIFSLDIVALCGGLLAFVMLVLLHSRFVGQQEAVCLPADLIRKENPDLIVIQIMGAWEELSYEMNSSVKPVGNTTETFNFKGRDYPRETDESQLNLTRFLFGKSSFKALQVSWGKALKTLKRFGSKFRNATPQCWGMGLLRRNKESDAQLEQCGAKEGLSSGEAAVNETSAVASERVHVEQDARLRQQSRSWITLLQVSLSLSTRLCARYVYFSSPLCHPLAVRVTGKRSQSGLHPKGGVAQTGMDRKHTMSLSKAEYMALGRRHCFGRVGETQEAVEMLAHVTSILCRSRQRTQSRDLKLTGAGGGGDGAAVPLRLQPRKGLADAVRFEALTPEAAAGADEQASRRLAQQARAG